MVPTEEESRSAFIDLTRDELDALETEMEKLESQLNDAPAGERANVEADLEQWNRTFETVQDRLATARGETSDGGWERFRSHVDTELDDLRHSFAELKRRIESET